MKKLLFKTILYTFLILLVLEVIIRVFHLTKDYPSRYVDEFNVEKWVPNQAGISVTGIRRQNFSEYKINSSGYNSYREYTPSGKKIEIALVGDSFIEGFHQHYYNSIGKKMENRLKNVEVYEFGYAGYDLADQLHLIHAYKDMFDKIDYVVLGLKFENDLTRSEHTIVKDRLKLETPLYRNLRKIKLLVFAQNNGILDPIRNFVSNLTQLSFSNKKEKINNNRNVSDYIKTEKTKQFIENFDTLINKYRFNKAQYVFLLDAEKTPDKFLKHLKANDFEYIDFSNPINQSKVPATLIYDKHWNNNGRKIIASLIANYFESKNQKSN